MSRYLKSIIDLSLDVLLCYLVNSMAMKALNGDNHTIAIIWFLLYCLAIWKGISDSKKNANDLFGKLK